MTDSSDLVDVSTFEPEARRVVSSVQVVFGKLVSALPGQVQRPHEIEKALGLDKVLAWKLAQFLETKDVFAAARYLPGTSALKIILDAGRRRGVEPQILEPAIASTRGLEEFIRIHAGDRASLDMMLQGLAPRTGIHADDAAGVEHRRMAFRGNSFIWGVQAKVRLMAMFLSPNPDTGRLDAVTVYGFVDLRRLRPDAPWLLSKSSAKDGQDAAYSAVTREPLEPSGVQNGVPILPAFCSQPLPQFRRYESQPGLFEEEMLGQGMGNAGAMTCIVGEVMRSAFTPVRDDRHQFGTVGCHMSTPTEVLILDLVVRADVFGPMRPELKVYGGLRMSASYPAPSAERFVLPVTERVEHVGLGAGAMSTKLFPRYEALGEYVFSKMGWDGERFDVYRTVMRYPPVPSTVMMLHDLPSR